MFNVIEPINNQPLQAQHSAVVGVQPKVNQQHTLGLRVATNNLHEFSNFCQVLAANRHLLATAGQGVKAQFARPAQVIRMRLTLNIHNDSFSVMSYDNYSSNKIASSKKDFCEFVLLTQVELEGRLIPKIAMGVFNG